MSALDELRQWLIMNVGSREAEECLALVERVVAESDPNIAMRDVTDEQRQTAHLLGFNLHRPETWPWDLIERLLRLKAKNGEHAMHDEIARLQGHTP